MFIVAIDGPAGTGKGTITKIVAEKLGLVTIDTGATYRCITLAMIKKNVKLEEEKIKEILEKSKIEFKNINGEQLLLELDSLGICASSGSACTSGQSEPSHVLTAIGLNAEYIQGSLRTTFGEENTKEDVEFLIKSIIEITNKIGKE